jgi:hypothetical protein
MTRPEPISAIVSTCPTTPETTTAHTVPPKTKPTADP